MQEVFVSGRPPLKTYEAEIKNTSSDPVPTTTLPGYTAITDGRKVVTTAGTRVQMTAGAIKVVIITAEFGNTGVVVVGSSTVIASASTRRGTPLYPGDSVVIETDDLSDLWLDSTVSGEGVTYTIEN